MDEEFVVIAEYTNVIAAQLAHARLEVEGIRATLSGNPSEVNVPWEFKLTRYRLHVSAADRDEALSVLTDEGEPELPADWDEPFNQEEGWLCSLCGTPVREGLEICPDCLTERGAIQGPSPTTSERPAFRPPQTPRTPEGFTAAPPSSLERDATPAAEADGFPESIDLPSEEELRPDVKEAQWALFTAVFGFLGGILLVYSLYLIHKLWNAPGGLTPRASRLVWIALFINLFWLFLFGLIILSRR